jgi:hypothetical protein
MAKQWKCPECGQWLSADVREHVHAVLPMLGPVHETVDPIAGYRIETIVCRREDAADRRDDPDTSP